MGEISEIIKPPQPTKLKAPRASTDKTKEQAAQIVRSLIAQAGLSSTAATHDTPAPLAKGDIFAKALGTNQKPSLPAPRAAVKPKAAGVDPKKPHANLHQTIPATDNQPVQNVKPSLPAPRATIPNLPLAERTTRIDNVLEINPLPDITASPLLKVASIPTAFARKKDTLIDFDQRQTTPSLPKQADNLLELTQDNSKRVNKIDTNKAEPLNHIKIPTQIGEPVVLNHDQQQELDQISEQVQKNIERLKARKSELNQIFEAIKAFPTIVAQKKQEFENRPTTEKIKGVLKSLFTKYKNEFVPPDLIKYLQEKFQNYSTEELKILTKNSSLIQENPTLFNVFSIGGESITMPNGRGNIMYKSDYIGKGGMAEVHEAYIPNEESLLHKYVVKEPYIESYPSQNENESDQDYANRRANIDHQNGFRPVGFAIEKQNVQTYLKEPIPGMMQSLGVLKLADGKEIIAYEKITNPEGKVEDFHSYSDVNHKTYQGKSVTFSAWVHDLSFAADTLNEYAKRGLVHLDFKLSNVVRNQQSRGVPIDPGSMFHDHDKFLVDPVNGVYKEMVNSQGVKTYQQLPWTPYYCDMPALAQAVSSGIAVQKTDHFSFGAAILEGMANSHLVSMPQTGIPKTHEELVKAFANSPLAEFNGTNYPTPALRKLGEVALQLMDITNPKHTFTMTDVANFMRALEPHLANELDPKHKIYQDHLRATHLQTSKAATELEVNINH